MRKEYIICDRDALDYSHTHEDFKSMWGKEEAENLCNLLNEDLKKKKEKDYYYFVKEEAYLEEDDFVDIKEGWNKVTNSLVLYNSPEDLLEMWTYKRVDIENDIDILLKVDFFIDGSYFIQNLDSFSSSSIWVADPTKEDPLEWIVNKRKELYGDINFNKA